MSAKTKRVRAGLWELVAVSSVGGALFSYRYLAPHPPLVGHDIAANLFKRPWLAIHASLAVTALLVGPFQFVSRLRARSPRTHRILGRVYVGSCLGAAPAALVLAAGTDAGPIAQAAFSTLAVIWFVFTLKAVRLAMAGRIAEHRRWMVRSFALTFAAVTLRLLLPFPPLLLHASFLDGYRAISWISWTSNLLIAEVWLNRTSLLGLIRGWGKSAADGEAERVQGSLAS
ncbi:MAG: DUF2306 domain-containing protein [Caulobacteraceae bacterium]